MHEQHVNEVSTVLFGLFALVALVGSLLLFSGTLMPAQTTGAQTVHIEQFCTVHADCPIGYTCQKFTTRPHAVMGKCLPLM